MGGKNPNFNSIKNLWALLKRRIQDSYELTLSSINELQRRIEKHWNNIHSNYYRKLVYRIFRRYIYL